MACAKETLAVIDQKPRLLFGSVPRPHRLGTPTRGSVAQGIRRGGLGYRARRGVVVLVSCRNRDKSAAEAPITNLLFRHRENRNPRGAAVGLLRDRVLHPTRNGDILHAADFIRDDTATDRVTKILLE